MVAREVAAMARATQVVSRLALSATAWSRFEAVSPGRNSEIPTRGLLSILCSSLAILDEQRSAVIVGGIRRDWQFLRPPLPFNNPEFLPGARASLFKNATRPVIARKETPRPSPPRHPEFDIKKSMLKSLGTLSYSLEIRRV